MEFNEVAIIREKRWHTETWRYGLFCLRCTSHVYGARTSEWASKAGAAKVAREHLNGHMKAAAYIERLTKVANRELVGMVTL